MTNQEIEDLGLDLLIFPDFDDCVIGITTDEQTVYSLQKMVNFLMERDDIDFDNAYEWIEYNTIRTIPYTNGKIVIVDDLHF